jgi:hypothetical protein
VFFSNK